MDVYIRADLAAGGVDDHGVVPVLEREGVGLPRDVHGIHRRTFLEHLETRRIYISKWTYIHEFGQSMDVYIRVTQPFSSAKE